MFSQICSVCDKNTLCDVLDSFPDGIINLIQSYIVYEIPVRYLRKGFIRTELRDEGLISTLNPLVLMSTDHTVPVYRFSMEYDGIKHDKAWCRYEFLYQCVDGRPEFYKREDPTDEQYNEFFTISHQRMEFKLALQRQQG